MKKMHVYIETSVWSFALAEDAPEYRSDTMIFLDLCRKRMFEPYVSNAVLHEIEFAQLPLRTRREEVLRVVRPARLPWLPEADALSDTFVREKTVPPSKPQDARHVAIAMAHGLDVLVSWNFRHIVNLRREERFNAIALLEGYHHRLGLSVPRR
jgi:predicted nucleic acid-binding protein